MKSITVNDILTVCRKVEHILYMEDNNAYHVWAWKEGAMVPEVASCEVEEIFPEEEGIVLYVRTNAGKAAAKAQMNALYPPEKEEKVGGITRA